MKQRLLKTLKENEGVWLSHTTILYKKDSRFDYYREGEKIRGTTFEFNIDTDKVIACVKSEHNIVGYIFNNVRVTPEEKTKIISGIKKHLSNTANIEKSFKPIFDNDTENPNITLTPSNIFLIGTRYNKDIKYINKSTIDTTMGNKFNEDPLVEFNILNYIIAKFDESFKNLFYDRSFSCININISKLKSLESDLYPILKKAYGAGYDNDRLFTLSELNELAVYICDHDYYYYENDDKCVPSFLIDKYIQTNKICDIIYSILTKYEMS